MRRDEFPIVEEYCKDKVVEELEKIKAEIRELSYNAEICTIDRYRVEEVINKHIKEYKQ